MKTKFVVITVVFAIVSFALSRVLWPDPMNMEMPTQELVPFFIGVSVIESLAFGVGVAFLVLGFPLVKRATENKTLTMWTYLAITWLLVSWWPHDNLHRINAHDNFVGLLRLEYGFHATLIIAGLVIAKFFVRQLKKSFAPTA